MEGRPIVGVDIDGVLGNQVDGVLQRVNARLGVALEYEHIVHWDMPLGDTSFKPEIADAMRDPEYILGMPVHDEAPEMLAMLRQSYVIKLITVRPRETLPLTRRWLDENGLVYNELVSAKEALKSAHAADALIDDYPGNLAEFLDRTDGVGILIDQPWNQDVAVLRPWLSGPRLCRITRLLDVPERLANLLP
jgi:5'(3')-deoxyribonucleotidase